jgi:hypothetical protein
METLGGALAAEPYLSTMVIGAGLLQRHPGAQADAHCLRVSSQGRPCWPLRTASRKAGTTAPMCRRASCVKATASVLDRPQGRRAGRALGQPLRRLGAQQRWRLRCGRSLAARGAQRARPACTCVPTRHATAAAPPTSFSTTCACLPMPCSAPKATALPQIEQAHDEATLAICAESIGVMRRLMRDTLDYVRQRKQFGVPISSFQVLQHRLADMHMALELAAALTASVGETVDAAVGARARTRRVFRQGGCRQGVPGRGAGRGAAAWRHGHDGRTGGRPLRAPRHAHRRPVRLRRVVVAPSRGFVKAAWQRLRRLKAWLMWLRERNQARGLVNAASRTMPLACLHGHCHRIRRARRIRRFRRCSAPSPPRQDQGGRLSRNRRQTMAGPLQGLRVIEMAGIGPGPFCAMLFADMGAEVVRIERPGTRTAPHDILARGRSTLQVDLRAEGAAQSVLDAVAQGRRAHRGLSPRRDGAPGPGPGRMPRAQPAPGVRPHDRLGPARPAGACGGPRHQLHRHQRRAARHRPCRRAAGAAAQLRGRLRRRRDAAGLRNPGRAARGEAARARAR